MINNALKKAKELLNDNTIKILRYAETSMYYLFEYENTFDNCMIKVDKKTNNASYYIITQHFDELDKLSFKVIVAE